MLRVGLNMRCGSVSRLLAMVTFTGLTLAVGDPFYEKIWKETELSLGGTSPSKGSVGCAARSTAWAGRARHR